MFVGLAVGRMYYDVKPSVFPVRLFRSQRFVGRQNPGVFERNGFRNEFSTERRKIRNPRLGIATS